MDIREINGKVWLEFDETLLMWNREKTITSNNWTSTALSDEDSLKRMILLRMFYPEVFYADR